MNAVTEKIKMICSDRNIEAEELADQSGLSVEQIELMYNSEKIPSLASLIKVARALGVRLGTFLDDSDDLGPVINRIADLQNPATFSSQLSTSNSHMDFFSLAARKAGRHMEPFLINIDPSSSAQKIASSHEGEEFLYVLKGAIAVDYGRERHILNEGDSIYYDSIVDHLVNAIGEEPAQILGVVYSPM